MFEAILIYLLLLTSPGVSGFVFVCIMISSFMIAYKLRLKKNILLSYITLLLFGIYLIYFIASI